MKPVMLIVLFLSIMLSFAHAETCRTLNAPKNGQMGGLNCKPGVASARCYFHCDSGYRLNGATELFCQSNGRWSPFEREPTCTLVSCSNLRPPTNGRISGKCTPGVASELCNFECNKGYRLVGAAQLRCLGTQQWDKKEPSCALIKCSKFVATGKDDVLSAECISGVVGGICKITCKPHQMLRGESESKCREDGNWSNNIGTCHDITCPDLGGSGLGELHGSCKSANPGDTCTLTCNAASRLVGSSKTTCLKTGFWSDELGICQEIFCPQVVGHKNQLLMGRCNLAQVGDICETRCNDKFKLLGSARLICTETGEWSSVLGYCQEINCPAIRKPGKGEVLSDECSTGAADSSCKITCDRHFRLNGFSEIKCLDGGIWSDEIGNCKEIFCPNLENSEIGHFFGECNEAKPGDICSIVCDRPTLLKGPGNATCTNSGYWSNDLGICEEQRNNITCTVTTSVTKIGKWIEETGKCDA